MDRHLLTVRKTIRIMKTQKIPKILFYLIRVVSSRLVEIWKEKEILKGKKKFEVNFYHTHSTTPKAEIFKIQNQNQQIHFDFQNSKSSNRFDFQN